MALQDWAKRKNRELHRKALEDRDSGLWHSGAYHRYFEGYTEYRVQDEKGKTHLKREYTSDWYIQDLEKKQYALLRVLYVVLFLMMAGMMVLAGAGQGSAGRAFYIALPEIATVCLMARLFYVLFLNYCFAPRKMTINDYRTSSPALKKAALWIAGGFGLNLVFSIVDYFLVRHGAEGAYQSFILVIAAFFMGALAALLMAKIEHHVPYRTEENKQKPREDGVPIENVKSQGLFRKRGRE